MFAHTTDASIRVSSLLGDGAQAFCDNREI